jgi:uncharacterized protein (TIGR02145 family)
MCGLKFYGQLSHMKHLFRSSSLILIILLTFLLHSCKKEEVPTLTTADVTNITESSATSGGTITKEGSGTIVERGICWSKSITPTIADNKTIEGGGSDTFVSNMVNLDAASTYYVRAYAKNEAGTGYGMAMSFTSLGQAATAITQSATNVTTTSATLNGIINPNYLNTTVTFEYGTAISYGDSITATQSPVTGSSNTGVTANVSGLMAGTIYHYQVKTVNSLGTVNGFDMTFTTLVQAPTATTKLATNVTTSSATLNGIINPNYLTTTVTFDYGTTTSYGNSITATQSPVAGNSNTLVTANISGLMPGTIYHYQVKTIYSLGTVNGNDLTFTTLGGAPTAVTFPAHRPTASGAILNGAVNANYFPTTVTFEYGLSTAYGSSVAATPSLITSYYYETAVSANLSGLNSTTTYHFRVKAVNSLGTTFGSDLTFTTTIEDGEGNVYNIVIIGTQVWMKENLRTTKYSNGDLIGTTSSPTLDISGESTPKYQWVYGGDESNLVTYGRLYTWFAVTDSRNVCPTGWHLPTDSEWTTLTTFLGGDNVAGGKLKETGTTHWSSPNTGATNETGFRGLPSGNRDSNGTTGFYNIRNGGNWWSSTEFSTTFAYCRHMFYNDSNLSSGNYDKQAGFSVRCLKDN